MGLNEEVAGIKTKLGTMDVSIDALTTATQAGNYATGVPSTATPFTAMSAVITGVTAVAVKTGTAGKIMYITQVYAVNKTTGEDQAIILGEATTAATVTDNLAIVAASDIDGLTAIDRGQTFVPALRTTAAKSIAAKGVISGIGDCYVVVNGYTQA